MKILLSSAGLTNDSIARALKKLITKPSCEVEFVVVPTAQNVENGSKEWYLDELKAVRRYFSDNIDIVDISALPKDIWMPRLSDTDVVYVTGGHTDYLMKSVVDSGFGDELKELLKEKVYFGSSAGAMLLGRRLSTKAYEKMYAEDDRGGYAPEVDDYLGLVDFGIIAHFNSPHFSIRKEDFIGEVSFLNDHDLYVLDDNSAVVIDGDNLEVVSEGEWKFLEAKKP